MNKFDWLMFGLWVLLALCLIWLVSVNMTRSDVSGLECVYNCDSYAEILRSL